MRALLLALALLTASAPAQARPAYLTAPPPQAPTWTQLSPAQRSDLAKLEQRWDGLPPERRARILERWRRWQSLPPEKQRELREGRRNFGELSPRQRERLRESMHALRELPPEEQQRLRAIWRGMTPEQRREWLRRGGPGLSAPP